MFFVAALACLLALAGSSLAQDGGSPGAISSLIGILHPRAAPTEGAAAAVPTEGAAAAASVAQLIANLREAPTEVNRVRLVQNDQFLLDFVDPSTVGVTNGAGDHTITATSENFPAVVVNGDSMSIGFLGPSGIDPVAQINSQRQPRVSAMASNVYNLAGAASPTVSPAAAPSATSTA